MDLSRWMEYLPPRLKEVPIYQLLLPGSHASSAFQYLRKPSVDTKAMKRLNRLAAIPNIRKFIERWVLTQELNLYDQLKLGIRKLDLIVGYEPKQEKFYLSRTVANIDLREGLLQVHRFLEEHPQEVLFLSVNYQQKFPLPLSDVLFEIFVSTLQPYLVSSFRVHRIEPNITLNHLVEINQRVFIVCTETHRHNDWVWGMDILDLDGDATNLEEEWKLLDDFLKAIKYARNIGRSFREITLNLVPGDDAPYLRSIIHPTAETPSNRTLAEDISTHMYQRLEEIDIKLLRKINFLSIDFVDQAFIEWVINYNIQFRQFGYY